VRVDVSRVIVERLPRLRIRVDAVDVVHA
jgi:hypothetical protein